jgi:hypothetical protein
MCESWQKASHFTITALTLWQRTESGFGLLAPNVTKSPFHLPRCTAGSCVLDADQVQKGSITGGYLLPRTETMPGQDY